MAQRDRGITLRVTMIYLIPACLAAVRHTVKPQRSSARVTGSRPGGPPQSDPRGNHGGESSTTTHRERSKSDRNSALL
jgi:hypothetical protein